MCADFVEVVSCVHYTDASTFITWSDDDGLDWLFLRLFDADFPCNVRLL